MSTIEKFHAYTCPSCAARLDLDEARTVYTCSSCGNTYDYNYFMSDDLLEKANNALVNNEYNSASQMYGFLLQKEPINFKATLGLFLSKMKVSDIKSLRAESFCVGPSYEDCSEFLVHTDDEHKEFFELASECFSSAKEVKNLNSKLASANNNFKEIRRKQGAINSKIMSNHIEITNKNGTNTFHPKDRVTILAIFAAIFAVIFTSPFVITAQEGSRLIAFIICLLITIAAAGITYMIAYSKYGGNINAIKALEHESVELSVEYNKIKEEIGGAELGIKKGKSDIANNIRLMKTIANK